MSRAGSGWSTGLNTLADKDDVVRVTRVINGGLNGLTDRQSKLVRAKFFLVRSEYGTERSSSRNNAKGDFEFVLHSDRASASRHRTDAEVRLSYGGVGGSGELISCQTHLYGHRDRPRHTAEREVPFNAEHQAIDGLLHDDDPTRSKRDRRVPLRVEDAIAQHHSLNLWHIGRRLSSPGDFHGRNVESQRNRGLRRVYRVEHDDAIQVRDSDFVIVACKAEGACTTDMHRHL
jgi:hypothetical protein